MEKLPAFQNTPVEEIPTIVQELRETFFTQKTKPIEFRLRQLRKLYWALVDHESLIAAALTADLRKADFEAQLSDIKWLQNDIIYVTNNLAKWAKEEKPADVPLAHYMTFPKVRKEPLGCVLVIGPFNFPFNITISPLIGAIAAGNTVVVKPSDQTPKSAAVIQMIMESCLDPSCYRVVNGAVPAMKALLAEKWDKIFFTGSTHVGKIIAKAAAPNLTPVTLELGGRNAAIVTQNADMSVTPRRLMWGRLLNTGQCCLSPNYVLVDRKILPALVEGLKETLQEFYHGKVKESDDYGRLVTPQHFARVKKMLDDTDGKILLGGTMDATEKFIEPTVVEVSSVDDSLLAEESFGPLLPLLPYDSLDEAITTANNIHTTALALYPFGSPSEVEKIISGIRSGGVSINDTLSHGIISTIEFGGVGDSGTGSYRGKASFDCFVHRRVVTNTPTWLEKLLMLRYPPYKGKLGSYLKLSVLKPGFDREGNVKFSLWSCLRFLATLGSGSASGGALRAAVVSALAFALYRGWAWKGQ